MAEADDKTTKQPASMPDAYSLFKPSWEAFRLNINAFVLLLIFPVGLAMLTALTWGATEANEAIGFLAIISLIFAVVASITVGAALIYLELQSAAGKRVGFEEAFRTGLPYILRLIGLLLLSGLIVCVGFILLIIPGIFALQRLLLAPYILVEHNTGIREAIRLSWQTGKKHSSALWGVTGIIIAINLVAIIPIVGWIVSFVLTIAYMCAPAIRYFQIKKLDPQTLKTGKK
jgi:hypothetical protein